MSNVSRRQYGLPMLTVEDSNRLQVLTAARNTSDGRTGNPVTDDAIFENIKNVSSLDQAAVRDYLVMSETMGHVSTDAVLSGGMHVTLTPAGKSAADEFDRLRTDPVSRIRQLQDDYLRWLYEQIEVNGSSPTPDSFLAAIPAFHGSPYTSVEIERAGARLAESAFISGPAAWQYKAPLRPRLTAKGRYAVEQGRSVHDVTEPKPVQSFTTNVHGNANVANASPGTEQHLTVHEAEWAGEVVKVLDAIAQALPSLGEETEGTAAALVSDARQAVEAEDRPRTLRALKTLGGFLADSASGALGGVLAVQVGGLLPLLGG